MEASHWRFTVERMGFDPVTVRFFTVGWEGLAVDFALALFEAVLAVALCFPMTGLPVWRAWVL